MPKKIDPNHVPIWVRPICYQCGVRFGDDSEKTNCRMCYDVFCSSCMSPNLLGLPATYGYTDSQPVCGTCDTLVHGFPMFASQLHGGHGGQLLDRRHRVITVNTPAELKDPNEGGGSSNGKGKTSSPTSSTLASNNSFAGSKRSIPAGAQVKNSSTRDSSSSGGFFGSVKSFFTGSSDKDACREEPVGPRNRASTSQLAATPKGRKALRAERATLLELHGWRPLGLDSAVVSGNGETRVYLKEIKTVEFKDHVVVNLMDGRRVEFIVVQSEGDVADTVDPGATWKEGSAFMVDASANFSLASGLASLVKICRGHFALTGATASMALHMDVQQKASSSQQQLSQADRSSSSRSGSGGRTSPRTAGGERNGMNGSSLLASKPKA